MSAIGQKRRSLVAPHMSAFGGKADMALCGMSAFAIAIGGRADIRPADFPRVLDQGPTRFFAPTVCTMKVEFSPSIAV
jgi:hypothetical protein